MGDFTRIRGRGGLGDMDASPTSASPGERLGPLDLVAWPEWGGRASLFEQVIFFEEYARARAPGRVGHIGRDCWDPPPWRSAPRPRRAFFPIVAGEELWCQGYEPNAGSDLAALQTRAERDGDSWKVTVRRSGPASPVSATVLRAGPHQPRCAQAPRDLLPARPHGSAWHRGGAHPPDDGQLRVRRGLLRGRAAGSRRGTGGRGWKVAMATLAFGGASTLGQQLGCPSRTSSPPPSGRGAGLIRWSASGWPRSGCGWRSCSTTACACSRPTRRRR